MIFVYPQAKFRVQITNFDFCMHLCCYCATVCPHVPCCAPMACTSRPQCACLCTNGLHQWVVFAPQRAIQCLLEKNFRTKFKTSRTIFCPKKIHIFRSTIKPIPTRNSRRTIFYDFSKFLNSKNRKYFFTQYFSFPFFFLDSYDFSLPTSKISGQNHKLQFLHAMVLLLCHDVPTCALLCTNGLHQWADFAPQCAAQGLFEKNSRTKFKTPRTIFCPNKIDIFRSVIKPTTT